jgi:NhaA family Na+:H+ antiporter
MRRAVRIFADYGLAVPLGAAIALVWANQRSEAYFRIAHELAFAVNNVGMAFFFALLAQEVLEAMMPGGALHTWRRATLPIVAAIGGTIGAIGAYNAFLLAGDEHVLLSGWPIVCAIDGGVAYLLVRFLLGRKGGARPFVVLMAIVSNAIGLIAIGLRQQSVQVQLAGPLLIAAGLGVTIWLTRFGLRTIWPQVAIGGALLWCGFWWSGLHPALALIPMVPCLPHSPRGVNTFDAAPPHGAHDSPRHLERVLRTPVQFILFLFAFVNAGVVIHGVERGAWAVPVGALAGRPAGMLAAVGVALALGLRLPHGVGWRELVVIALAVSSAFTFGLFFATATFATGPVLTEAKIGALSTIGGALLTIAVARVLAVRTTRS